MKAKELKNVLIHSILFNRRPLVTGAPGIGKSEVIKQAVWWIHDIATGKIQSDSKYAKVILANVDYWKKIELVILHPVTHQPVDYRGFPFIRVDENGVEMAGFAAFSYLEDMIKADHPMVVFFDDMGQAPQTVQAALMQVLLERSINGKKISINVRFVAATNRRKDAAGVSSILTSLLNRFSVIVEMEVCAEAWVQWAIEHQLPITVIAFIRFNPKALSNFTASKEIENFASPRSVEELGKWINEGEENVEVWSGCVGSTFTAEFAGFYRSYAELHDLPEQIFSNPSAAKVPVNPDILYTLVGMLTKRTTTFNVTTVFKYINRLPTEFQHVFVSNIKQDRKDLFETKVCVDWVFRNGETI